MKEGGEEEGGLEEKYERQKKQKKKHKAVWKLMQGWNEVYAYVAATPLSLGECEESLALLVHLCLDIFLLFI